jgi:hypothetical protein
MQVSKILRLISLIVLTLSFILGSFGFWAFSNYQKSKTEMLGQEVVAPTSTFVLGLIGNRKTLLATFGVASVAFVGTYYYEIKEAYTGSLDMCQTKDQIKNQDGFRPIIDHPNHPKNRVNQNLVILETPNNPYEESFISEVSDSSEEQSYNSDLGSSGIDDMENEDNEGGFLRDSMRAVGSFVVESIKQASIKATIIGATAFCKMHGLEFSVIKDEVFQNPMVQSPFDKKKRTKSNTLSLLTSVAKSFTVINPVVSLADGVIGQRSSDQVPKEVPTIMKSITDVGSAILQGGSEKDIKKVVQDKAISYISYKIGAAISASLKKGESVLEEPKSVSDEESVEDIESNYPASSSSEIDSNSEAELDLSNGFEAGSSGSLRKGSVRSNVPGDSASSDNSRKSTHSGRDYEIFNQFI